MPDQYVQPKSQMVTVKANETATVSFSNVLKKWEATITKVDAETGAAQGDASLPVQCTACITAAISLTSTPQTPAASSRRKSTYAGITGIFRRFRRPADTSWILRNTRSALNRIKYTLEHNQIPIGVKEQAIKGKIQIHKQYETLEGTPKDEAAAEFQVYLKSAGSYDKAKAFERDTIITSASGYAVTKNMPYGT